MNLLISFPDQSESFAHGAEYGRLLQRMEQGDEVVMNSGFPIRVENKALIEETCRTLGYLPVFGQTYYGEWIDFIAVKKTSSEN